VCRSGGSGGEVAGDARSGELGSVGEAAERAEAVCGGETDEVKTGDGGLEVCTEDGSALDRLHLITQLLMKEAETVQLHLISGCGDDVIDKQLFGGAVALAEVQMDTFAIALGFLHGGAKMHGDEAIDLASGEPAGGRAVDVLHGVGAELRGHGVEDQREIGAEAGAPALAKAGTGPEDALVDGARLGPGGRVKVDGLAAGDPMDLGTGLVQEAGQIGRRGPGTEDGYAASGESGEIFMLRTMRDKLTGQVGEDGGMSSPVCVTSSKPADERWSEVMSVCSRPGTKRL